LFGAAPFRADPLWLQLFCGLGCGLDRGWPTGALLPREKARRPAGPPPADPWAGRVFSSARAVPGGGLQEGAYNRFAVWLLIDSMILPQVHLRNGEDTAVLCEYPVRYRKGPTIS
jgi:hypothetical protein